MEKEAVEYPVNSRLVSGPRASLSENRSSSLSLSLSLSSSSSLTTRYMDRPLTLPCPGRQPPPPAQTH